MRLFKAFVFFISSFILICFLKRFSCIIHKNVLDHLAILFLAAITFSETKQTDVKNVWLYPVKTLYGGLITWGGGSYELYFLRYSEIRKSSEIATRLIKQDETFLAR